MSLISDPLALKGESMMCTSRCAISFFLQLRIQYMNSGLEVNSNNSCPAPVTTSIGNAMA